MSYNTVIWDFDGTLAFTAADVWGSLCYAAKALGSVFPPQLTTDGAALSLPIKELAAMACPSLEGQMEAFSQLTDHHYRQLSRHPNTKFYPGILPLLTTLKAAGIPCHVVTNKEAEGLARLLDIKGWRHWFGHCYSPDSFPEGRLKKPDLLARLLKQLPQNTAAVYIGDSASDVAAARQCGLPCIGVTYGDGDRQALLAQQPDFIASSGWEIGRYL